MTPVQNTNPLKQSKTYLYMVLIIFYIFLFYKFLVDSGYNPIFKGINLGVHEMGHIFFGFFGIEILTVAGGTIMQLLFPIFAFLVLIKQKDYFGLSFIIIWFATNLFDIAAYIADARVKILPLVNVGFSTGEVIHDWEYMLAHWGILESNLYIASVLRFFGFVFLVAGVLWGMYYLTRLFINSKGLVA